MKKTLRFGDGKFGWTFDPKQISDITNKARDYYIHLSMEEVEAVLLALMYEEFIRVDGVRGKKG